MAVSLVTYPSVFASFMGWPRLTGTGRTVEVPSVEPTSDGFVVFTTNSAQQFQDFLVLIDRSDWLVDEKLARAQHRFARRQEFLGSVHQWSMKRTSAEALEEAGRFRIPAGPVLNGSTVAGFEQFEARRVFERAPSGRFRQPRRPYRIDGVEVSSPRPAPEVGADDGRVDWPARPPGRMERPGLPLTGIRILDCTAWWAGPSATHVLAALGADVLKIESVKRPDLMRTSSTRPPTQDGWWEWGPLFHAANTGKRGVTLDLGRPEGIDIFERLMRSADVLVENYTPRVMEQFGLGWDRLHQINPRLAMVRMPAFGLDGPWRDRTGFAQTMECISGLAWRTGYPDGPPVLPRGPCDPLAGMHAVLATVLALRSRASDGVGRLVEVTMVEAALAVAAEQIIEWDATGTLLGRDGTLQGVYRCAGDDEWIAVAVESEQQRQALGRVVGMTDGPDIDDGAIEEAVSAWCQDLDKDQAANLLAEVGVPAAAVVSGPDMSRNPQLRHRKLFETEDHPVTGRHELPGIPFRFSDVDHWMTRPSPTLGQHNKEVLAEVATTEELSALQQAGIIGERLVDP
jgi:crotonobetainyl-CoA:carnitine CoA-transferase CaiB-like acyl-CoA transferase